MVVGEDKAKVLNIDREAQHGPLPGAVRQHSAGEPPGGV